MNKLLTALSYLILLVIVGAVIGGGYGVYLAIGATIAAIPPVAWLVAGGAALFAIVFVATGGAIALVRRWWRSSRYVRPTDSLFPLVDLGGGIFYNGNEPGAQSLAALAAGRRPTAALAGRVIDAQWRNGSAPDAPALPAPEPAALTVQQVVDVDPRTAPHWLLVGSTGSGKTIASYAILAELARRAPCQFVITEPGGVNWGRQTTATSTLEIARAVIGVQWEMERRQVLLRRFDVDHVQDLADPLPYIVLVAEETETVLDDLRLTDRDTRQACIIALRSIARLGRKAGVCLVAVTQAASADLFDMHVRRNMTNTLLFRSEHTVGETWRVSRDIRLGDLRPGMAYSVQHGSLVQFPRVPRPDLAAEPLELPEPVLASEPIMVENWPQHGSSAPVLAGSAGSGPVLEANAEPDAVLAAAMRSWHASGASKNEIVRRVWPAKNGITWSILDRVLSGEL